MNKIIPAMIVALLSFSAIGLFASTEVDGATVKERYTNALLPDVYMIEVIDVSSVNVSINGSPSFPVSYRLYAPGKETAVLNGLNNGTLPAADYSGSGPGLLYVFTHNSPSRIILSINHGPATDTDQLVLVKRGVSFLLESDWPVKITRQFSGYGMYFGISTGGRDIYLGSEVNRFIIPETGEWRIYSSWYDTYNLQSQIFLSFTIEYETSYMDAEMYGYAMLAVGAACIGLVAISAGRQRIKD